MEAIFHEKQEGSLCAQHCLNALLQGPYFTPVDLASLAQRMDDEERLRMSESGVDSDEYRRFLEQPSGNYDDSGYFSVQVISSALEVWGLELIPYNSTEPRALEAQSCPSEMQAFICNYRDHWFTIRRLGHQWFNLNSLLTGPELISDTYLAMFLAQLQQEGYSIFVVFGELPESEADNLLKLVPAVQTIKPRLLTAVVRKVVPTNVRSSVEDEIKPSISLSLGSSTTGVERIIPIDVEPRLQGDDGDLQAAISLSLQGPHSEPAQSLKLDDEELQLQRALRMSIETDQSNVSSILPRTISQDEDLQLQQALRLSLQPEVQCEQEDEARDLERALKLSLECSDSNNQVDVEEVRRRRLAYLEGVEDRNSQLSPASVKNEVNS